MKKIHEGRANRETCFALLNRPYDQRQPGDWWEIEEAEYWSFLECLPPLAMTGGSFSMSEFIDGDMTNAFHKIGRDEDARFFAMLIRSPEFDRAGAMRALIDARAALLAKINLVPA